MLAAAVYNMMDFRAMHGRSRAFDVYETTYRHEHHAFGRVPIVIHLGDFLQLSPTASLGLIADVNEKNEDGSYKYPEPPTLEVQHAIQVFARISLVFELKGTKRFEAGDPLIEFLACMRTGRRFPEPVWAAFAHTFAADNDGSGRTDPRHAEPNFRDGYGMAIYWEALVRWMSQRARRGAREAQVPLVFLQAVDECNTIDGDAARRLLNVPNPHNTGHIHGVLPVYAGMEVRFTAKVNSQLGLVQEQRATVLSFLFHEEDQLRYNACRPGELFRPRYRPAGIWLDVHGFNESPIWEEALPLVNGPARCAVGTRPTWGIMLYRAVEQEFKWRSSDVHTVRRTGFPLTHASFLTSTASQGQTLRRGTTIDCARLQPQGAQGLKDDQWWLHLYVMLSRVTCMRNLLLLRPPTRDFLERGPPSSVREALKQFEQKSDNTAKAAVALADKMRLPLPAH